MADDFTISVYINDENIHLRLSGEWDEFSTNELINVLDRYCRRDSRIFIHTNCLKQVRPFHRELLQSYLDRMKGKCLPPIFTGDNAYRLAPNGSKLY